MILLHVLRRRRRRRRRRGGLDKIFVGITAKNTSPRIVAIGSIRWWEDRELVELGSRRRRERCGQLAAAPGSGNKCLTSWIQSGQEEDEAGTAEPHRFLLVRPYTNLRYGIMYG